MKRVYGKANTNYFESTDKYLRYSEVARNQVYLTEDEEIELTYRYQALRNELHKHVLSKFQCRRWFIDNYHATRDANKSVAKLSADFNPRAEGYNEQLENRMIAKLDPPPNTGEWRDLKEYQWEVIFSIHPSEYCYGEMISLMPETKKLNGIQLKISVIEDTLLRSMLMAAHGIANRFCSKILSIDETDAAQEVCIYMLEAIRKYKPEYRTPQGKRVKLFTYAYGRAERLIQEWILTNSRLVRVPRSKMERILIIVKAFDSIINHRVDLISLTDRSNEILKKRKGTLAKTVFTIEEVDDLTKILLSSYMHLDQPLNSHLKGQPITIGDMISNEEPSTDNIIVDKENKIKLLQKVRETLTDLEYKVIILWYFYDPADKLPKALTEVSALLVSVYNGVEYSRESIRQIEKAALEKLKKVREVQNLW